MSQAHLIGTNGFMRSFFTLLRSALFAVLPATDLLSVPLSGFLLNFPLAFKPFFAGAAFLVSRVPQKALFTVAGS